MKEMIQKRMASRGQSGFTLIELLVVIAILAILGGVVVFAVGNVTSSAEDSACDIEKRMMQTAVEASKGASGANKYDASAFIEGGATSGTYWEITGDGTAAVAASAVAGAPVAC